jgi:hypothetical protein
MWELTPRRPCDRELILHSAAWYERNEPWALGGVHALVQRALDDQQDQQREAEPPSAVRPTQRAQHTPAQLVASNETELEVQDERLSARQRYARPRG